MISRNLRVGLLGSTLLTLLGWTASRILATQVDDPYIGIREDAGFPADRGTLNKIREDEDVGKMRAHAWWVWSLIHEESKSEEGGEKLPRWRTWYRKDEVFQPAQLGAESSQEKRELRHVFEVPVQLREPDVEQTDTVSESTSSLEVKRSSLKIASGVFFNSFARDHIRDNSYHLDDTLNSLAAKKEESIEEFPEASVVLKTQWWWVKKEGSQVPVWDFDVKPVWDDNNGTRRSLYANEVEDWPRLVEVRPDAALEANPAPSSTEVEVVPLSRFHKTTLTADEAKSLGDLLEDTSVKEGDYLVLVGMHVITKELKDWVWATFWWHDTPERGPYAGDRPSSVTGVWRNFLMDTTMSKTLPREFDGSYNVCYNPWLEGIRKGGFISNCIRCHQHAKWNHGENVQLRDIARHSAQNPELFPKYEKRLNLDYIFSLVPGRNKKPDTH